MSEERIQRAVSDDGTDIAGRVHGHGHPLVLLPAGPGDSDTCWAPLLPLLREHFTCFVMDTRNRGLSGVSTDLSPERLVQDVTAFVDSIGEPVSLLSWGSTLWALVAAQDTTAVSAVAAYEPAVMDVLSDEEAALFMDTFTRLGEQAADGRLVEAAQTFVESAGASGVYTDEDMADGAPSDFWVASAPNIPVWLQEFEQATESEVPSATDPSVLAEVTVPVLLLHGARSHPWLLNGVRHVTEHVADPHVREISRAGHWGPHTEPDAVADELVRFFATAPARAE